MSLEVLPQDCIAHILSCTSPRDACRLAMISETARRSADSDTVWEKFLPPDYRQILSRLVSPLLFASKKELYFKLCNPLLIDGGKKSFSISKETGKICYMMSARDLSITWSTNALYWSWKPLLQSRFAEAAELRTISWLEIVGKIKMRMLSRKTRYEAWLVVKFAERAYGLDTCASEVSLVHVVVGKSKYVSHGLTYLRCCCCCRRGLTGEEGSVVPRERQDGWMEIRLGEFYNHGDGGGNDEEEEVKMSLKEVKGPHLKGGLIVEGIEIRPID